MKPVILVFLLFSALFCSRGAEKISRSGSDLLKIEDLTFGLAFWDKDWNNGVSQQFSPSSVAFPGEGAANTPLGLRRQGTFQTPASGKFEFTETVRRVSDTEQHIRLELKSAEGISAAMLVFRVREFPCLFTGNAPRFSTGGRFFRRRRSSFSAIRGKTGVCFRYR